LQAAQMRLLARTVFCTVLRRKIRYCKCKWYSVALCSLSNVRSFKFGDKVVTTHFSFMTILNLILFCDAKHVFADIALKTFNIDLIELEKTLKTEKNIKSVLTVRLC
jgi:dTDP-4-amino-4,6-dideoxygalactose transaminase